MGVGRSKTVAGVYQIWCKHTPNRIYVGSSVDIMSRWRKHRENLSRNRHASKLLQEDWNLYGADGFIFSVLYRVPSNTVSDERGRLDMEKIEQSYIDSLKPEYNTLAQAGVSTGYIHTDEARARMRTTERKPRQ